jgi:AcrR family transcriptional regulator
MSKTDSETREQWILDAAARLFVQYGYDKTAVADIARAAGISKGAIYLHFQSKDALLEALIRRETERYAASWLAGIDADPQGGTIGGMYKNILVALDASEFMAAVFRRDGRILGNYLRKPGNLFRISDGRPSPRADFVRLMQEAGAVRSDIEPEVIAHIMNMLSYGLITMHEFLPQEEIPPLEELVDGIALFMNSALTPAGGAGPEIGKQIINRIADEKRMEMGNG